MSLFTYTPLDLEHSAFRLVRLQKGITDEIECELVTTTLDENVIPYEAVSYTWGSREKPYSIKIQGGTMNITYNLSCLLRHLRQPESDRYLWIDAISINQDDFAERAHQVQQMKTIYHNADRVLFCLGWESTTSTNMLMTSLLDMQSMTRGFHWHSDDVQWRNAWKDVQLRLRHRHGDRCEEQQREGLEQILNQPWFRRIWILQEVASARKALVCYRTDFVPSHIFVMGIHLIGVSLSEHAKAVVGLMPGPEGLSRTNYRTDLYSILTRFSKAEASDQRDRIFALLGLCTDQHNLRPDYICPINHLLADLDCHLFGELSDPNNDGSRTREPFNIAPMYENIEQYLSTLHIRHETMGKDISYVFSRLIMGGKYETAISILEGQNNQINLSSETILFITRINEERRIMDFLVRQGGKITVDAKELLPKMTTDGYWFQSLFKTLLHLEEGTVRILAKIVDLRQLLLFIPQEDIEVAIKMVVGDGLKEKTFIKELRLALFLSPRHTHRRMTVETFLRKGAAWDAEPVSLLLAAVKAGATDAVKLLIPRVRSGCTRPKETTNWFNWDFIDRLLVGGDVNAYGIKISPFVRLLLDAGIDADICDCHKQTLLHYAAKGGYSSVVRMLLAGGANPNAYDDFEKTPLHYAARIGNVLAVRLLLNGGANVNARDNCEDTPLHDVGIIPSAWRLSKEHLSVYNILLEAGADPNSMNSRGKTPFNLARRASVPFPEAIL
ncbi:hypothetical protein GQX73_g9214 [Xylaria multiplex]|uniref:Heterokaryon incompatibility domain-containing protein n=1 Tax=Xylaria multiplex TaxID=323545 RepID=A0A7C8MLQ9_9PEZI|nr:hypothetical protein GQX73_g9214 [Xylaria multiplex]